MHVVRCYKYRQRSTFGRRGLKTLRQTALVWCLVAGTSLPHLTRAEDVLSNNLYTLSIAENGNVSANVNSMSPRLISPEFTVLRSSTDPQIRRNQDHPNHVVAPRRAVRWHHPEETVSEINAWLAMPKVRKATGLAGRVHDGDEGRIWEFVDHSGKTTVRVTGRHAYDTSRPFAVGSHAVMIPSSHKVEGRRIHWNYEKQPDYTFAAELLLPPGNADPVITYTITPFTDAYFSVAYTGAPEEALNNVVRIPQECAARGYMLFDYVMSEADLKLPRAHVGTTDGNVALVVDPAECRFRLPTIKDSRFGFMLMHSDNCLRPILFAPLLGGPESKMVSGDSWSFSFRIVIKPGDWKETFSHIARDIHGFRDERDNSGPGAMNGTLERLMDFISDRNGKNYAMWDHHQKYFDYFVDKTGVYKPFSPLYGLGAAIVTDDEEFFKQRALPNVEFALTRPNNVFAPYDNVDNKHANSAVRHIGTPYVPYAQLVSLYELFQRRTPLFRVLAEQKQPAAKVSDALALWQLTGEEAALNEARKVGMRFTRANTLFSQEAFFDALALADATQDKTFVNGAIEAAYQNLAAINLYPSAPDTNIVVDPGGLAFVHGHSSGRHRNQWGYPKPQPIAAPEQKVPAWRISRVGLPSIAYPIEYWINTFGAMMRTAGLAKDDFLRDVARSGMVGRFGNYPGDNRTQDSLVSELPNAVDTPPWKWSFATVNPGHGWDFVGAIIDFMVSDAFNRSHGAVDFPAVSAAGSGFQVRVYGAKPGKIYEDDGVYLWIPKGLLTTDNPQIDWLAGHGNGSLYLVLWNQSPQEEAAVLNLNPELAKISAGTEARVWVNNQAQPPQLVTGNSLAVTFPPKGIVAFAIPANVKPRLQAKMYDPSVPPLGPYSMTKAEAPFGAVHASLIRAGRDLTSAYVYTDALPEDIISARLQWRQGDGDWKEIEDNVYPYEFSPRLEDDKGDFFCVLEIEDHRQQIHSSPVMALSAGDTPPSVVEAPAAKLFSPLAAQPGRPGGKADLAVSDNFVDYLQRASNEHSFGKRADGRYYPYSTQNGRRIAARQIIWDKALFEKGCTEEEARLRLESDLVRVQEEMKESLIERTPPVDFSTLSERQRETLLDLGYTEGVPNLRPELVESVLSGNWGKIINECLYVRYFGHVPDHARNRAFAQRWNIK